VSRASAAQSPAASAAATAASCSASSAEAMTWHDAVGHTRVRARCLVAASGATTKGLGPALRTGDMRAAHAAASGGKRAPQWQQSRAGQAGAAAQRRSGRAAPPRSVSARKRGARPRCATANQSASAPAKRSAAAPAPARQRSPKALRAPRERDSRVQQVCVRQGPCDAPKTCDSAQPGRRRDSPISLYAHAARNTPRIGQRVRRQTALLRHAGPSPKAEPR
jgi:hypothetical protein